MAPRKLLPLFVRLIVLAPAFRVTSPVPAACEIAPFCEMPAPVRVKVPLPTEEVPRLKAILLIRATLLLPVLVKETSPVKLLLCVKLIALDPALKLAVPGTVKAPVSLMVPPARATRLPLLCSVKAGKLMPVLVNCRVRLRKLERLAKLVGSVAPLSMFCNLKSRILLKGVPKLIVPLKSLAAVLRSIIDEAAVEAKLTAPALAACVMAPVSLRLPPLTIVREPLPRVEAASVKAPLLVNETALLLLLFSATAPVKLLPLLLRLMTLAPALIVTRPPPAACVRAPLCEMPAPVKLKRPLPTEEVPILMAETALIAMS